MRTHHHYAIVSLILVVTASNLFARKKEIVFARDTTVAEHILVPKNSTCIFKPGITIRFCEYRKIVVKGLLIAEGTRKQPIRITCVQRPRGSTDKPCWNGLVIYGEKAHASLKHCRIEGAYKNLVWQARPVFDSCEFAGNHYALYCINKAVPHVNNSSFYRNVYGVVSDYASPLLLDNNITENVVGVYMQLSAQLVAGKNVIANNKTNVRTEQCLGPNNEILSLQYLWDLMREIY
ncbi:MAG: hypothetical protein GF398_20125 [Chitinivibrionales bacterium]|nr:hypothetical protein [Chitinivibrionales bacterium]